MYMCAHTVESYEIWKGVVKKIFCINPSNLTSFGFRVFICVGFFAENCFFSGFLDLLSPCENMSGLWLEPHLCRIDRQSQGIG